MKISLVTCQKIPNGTKDDFYLAQQLLKRGHKVSFDIWSDKNVAWSKYDWVVLRSTWDYYHHINDFLIWAQSISSKTNLLNSINALRWNYEKSYLLELSRLGVMTVPTHICSDRDLTIIEDMFDKHKKIVLKPQVSASAANTFKIESKKQIAPAVENIIKGAKVVAQPFINSVVKQGELSLIFLFNKDWQFSHAVQKLPKSNDFRVQSEHGGTVLDFFPQEDLIDFARQSLRLVPGINLYARVDIVDWNIAPLIMEIELIEPELFFRCSEISRNHFVTGLEAMPFG